MVAARNMPRVRLLSSYLNIKTRYPTRCIPKLGRVGPEDQVGWQSRADDMHLGAAARRKKRDGPEDWAARDTVHRSVPLLCRRGQGRPWA